MASMKGWEDIALADVANGWDLDWFWTAGCICVSTALKPVVIYCLERMPTKATKAEEVKESRNLLARVMEGVFGWMKRTL